MAAGWWQSEPADVLLLVKPWIESMGRWNKERYANDPQFRARESARHRAYYQAHKHERNAHLWQGLLKRRYGITQAEYDALLAKQAGACAICRRQPKGRLCVDHCHLTGRIRGLLCHKCNIGLGNLREDHRTLIAALAYLAYRAADGPGAAAQRALLARAALPPGHAARAVLTEVRLPNPLRCRADHTIGRYREPDQFNPTANPMEVT